MALDDRYSRLYRILIAFATFPGLPSRVIDSADALDAADLDALENALRKLAARMQHESRGQWPELHTASDKILRTLDGR